MKNANLLIAAMLAIMSSLAVGMGLMKIHLAKIEIIESEHEEVMTELIDSFQHERQKAQLLANALEEEIVILEDSLNRLQNEHQIMADALHALAQENEDLQNALAQNIELYNALSTAHDGLLDRLSELTTQVETVRSVPPGNDELETEEHRNPEDRLPLLRILINVILGIIIVVLIGAASLRWFFRPRKWRIPAINW